MAYTDIYCHHGAGAGLQDGTSWANCYGDFLTALAACDAVKTTGFYFHLAAQGDEIDVTAEVALPQSPYNFHGYIYCYTTAHVRMVAPQKIFVDGQNTGGLNYVLKNGQYIDADGLAVKRAVNTGFNNNYACTFKNTAANNCGVIGIGGNNEATFDGFEALNNGAAGVYTGSRQHLRNGYVSGNGGPGVQLNSDGDSCVNVASGDNAGVAFYIGARAHISNIVGFGGTGANRTGVSWASAYNAYITDATMINCTGYGFAFPAASNTVLVRCKTYNCTSGHVSHPYGMDIVSKIDCLFPATSDGVVNYATRNLAPTGSELTNVEIAINSVLKNYVTAGLQAQVVTPDYPSEDDVRDGVTYSTYTGNLVLPTESEVKDTIGFGSNGTEYEGNVTLPIEAHVLLGQQYGANGTEFEGELDPSSTTTPYIISISPEQGTTVGNNNVVLTVKGAKATKGAGKVEFGGIEATGYSSWSTDSITCSVPAGVGIVDVKLTNSDGLYDTKTGGYEYVASTNATGDIAWSVTFKEDRAEMENYWLEHIKSMFFLRPTNELNRGATTYDSNGLPSDLELDVTLYADGEQTTATHEAKDINQFGEVTVDTRTRSRRLYTKLAGDVAEVQIVGRAQYYQAKDTPPDPDTNKSTEAGYQETLGSMIFWMSRGQSTLKNMVTGSITEVSTTGTTPTYSATGPDGRSNTAIAIGSGATLGPNAITAASGTLVVWYTTGYAGITKNGSPLSMTTSIGNTALAHGGYTMGFYKGDLGTLLFSVGNVFDIRMFSSQISDSAILYLFNDMARHDGLNTLPPG
jgi:hypothetical protein